MSPIPPPSLISRTGRRVFVVQRRLLTQVLRHAALVVIAGAWSVAGAQDDHEHHARLLKQSVVVFKASAFSILETGGAVPPHLEILFDVPSRGNEIHAHHLPGWIRISVDRLAPVEHTYTDEEWHALADGALHLLLTAPSGPGAHTVAVTFKGIDRNGKPYLRTKSFSLESPNPSEHYVLRFHAPPNDEPFMAIEPLGASLLRPSAGSPAPGELAYRIGRFEAASGNHHNAASAFLAALQSGLPEPTQSNARLRLAESYGALGAPEEAESLLERLATEASDAAVRARAWVLIERIAYQDGRHDRVIQAHSRLGANAPPDLAGEAHALAGMSALALRAFSQAADFFRAVPKASADAPLALFGQAQALAGQGDAFTATTLFSKLTQTRSLFAASHSDMSFHAHAALGFQFLVQGRYQEAVAELGRVPSDHALAHASLFGIGWGLQNAGEHVKAIAVFDDLVTRAPDGPYAHEARLAMAASYAALRAPTRSVAAYRAALDALAKSTAALDRLRTVVAGSAWDPLSDYELALPADARRLVRDTPTLALAVERYRWLVHVERDLRRTLAEFPAFLTAPGANTLGGRLHTKDGSRLVAQGQELLTKIDVVERESRKALSALIIETADRERDRLEGWSVAASLGIARNLRDDLGGEGLTLE
ncbi:MAG TPA: tetratricopeptide repeat protein [Nitrospiria bacterium]|nr:tetratricopeptide repeat protein [Nitrospiria bacterium]